LRNNIVDSMRGFAANGKRAVDKEVALEHAPLADLLRAVVNHDETPSKELVRQEWREQLHCCLERLPPESRRLIQWRNYDLLTFTEIGHRLGCSREAARNAWARAIQLLTSQKRLE
jgi:RNA polymerase sigma factor (sigma-70 family)